MIGAAVVLFVAPRLRSKAQMRHVAHAVIRKHSPVAHAYIIVDVSMEKGSVLNGGGWVSPSEVGSIPMCRRPWWGVHGDGYPSAS